MEEEKQKAMKDEKGKAVKRAYSDVDCDFDVEKPHLIAAADVDVEDKVKVDGASASFKYPKTVSQFDPTCRRRHKELLAAYNCAQEYFKTRGTSTRQENHQEPKPAIEDPNPTLTVRTSDLLDPAQHEKIANDNLSEGQKKSAYLKSIHQSVRAAKQAMGICMYGEVHSYNHFSYKSLDGHTIEVLARESGDYVETVYYRGVLHIKPGLIVIAAGGVPQDLKIRGAVSLWYPSPVSRIHKDLLKDPTKRVKAMRDAFMEVRGKDAYRKAILQAYEKAYNKTFGKEKAGLNSKQPDEEARNRGKPPLSMIEVNLVLPRATGSTLDQVNYLKKWNYF